MSRVRQRMHISKRDYPVRFGLLLSALALPACTVGPDYQAPTVATPAHWTEPLPTAPDAEAKELGQWWRGFKDRRLDALIERALQGNLDLQGATARLSASRAQLKVAAAERWPSLGASGGYQRERISPNAIKGLIGSAIGNGGASNGLLSNLGPVGDPFNLFLAGFDSTWELDFFGGIQRKVEAAQANSQAMEEGRRDIRVSLAAEVAREYLGMTALRHRLDLAKQRLENQRKIRELAEAAFDEGLASALDVKRAKAAWELAKAGLPPIDAQIKNTGHRLAVLLGQPPGAMEAEWAAVGQDLPAPPALQPVMPSDLLRRRPDIRQAERNLAASTASVGAAVAELFPKISLTGSVGFQSQDLSNFTNFSSGFYGFGPRLSLPIFQAGRLLANIDAQEARTAEALKAYEKTVLTAFREVEDALAELNAEQRRLQDLTAAAATSRSAAEAALAFYEEGEADMQTVLDANRVWFDAEEQWVLSEQAWATGHVALYKALGGGWEMEGSTTPSP